MRSLYVAEVFKHGGHRLTLLLQKVLYFQYMGYFQLPLSYVTKS